MTIAAQIPIFQDQLQRFCVLSGRGKSASGLDECRSASGPDQAQPWPFKYGNGVTHRVAVADICLLRSVRPPRICIGHRKDARRLPRPHHRRHSVALAGLGGCALRRHSSIRSRHRHRQYVDAKRHQAGLSGSCWKHDDGLRHGDEFGGSDRDRPVCASRPATLAGGWRASLAIWAVFAGLALLFWLPEACKPAETVIALAAAIRKCRNADLAFGAGVAGHAFHGPAISRLLRHARLDAVISCRSRRDAGAGRMAPDTVSSRGVWLRLHCAPVAAARRRSARRCGVVLRGHSACHLRAFARAGFAAVWLFILGGILRHQLYSGLRFHRHACSRSSACCVAFDLVAGQSPIWSRRRVRRRSAGCTT